MSNSTQADWPPSLNWRQVVLGLVLLGIWALINQGCDRLLDVYDRNTRATAAIPFLEAANTTRSHVGLWPVTSELGARSYDGDSIAHLRSIANDDTVPRQSYQPYLKSKDILYSSEDKRIIKEIESIFPSSHTEKGKCPEYQLSREYSYTAAAQGDDPWSIKLQDYCGDGMTEVLLTFAQSDSVLTCWRTQATQDSLATHSTRR